jgi:MGT family glycosyltransferase
MARLLMITTPAAGHVNPLLPLAAALVEHRHEVHWYTGSAFKERIQEVGAIFHPIVNAVDHSAMRKDEAFPQLAGLEGLPDFIESWKVLFMDMAVPQIEDLQAIVARLPCDLIVSDETTFSAALLSEITGVPHVMLSTSVYFFSSRDAAPLGLGMEPWPSVFGWVRNALLYFTVNTFVLRELRTHADRTREKLGLTPIPGRVLENVAKFPDLYLMCTVPEFEYPRGDMLAGTRFIGPLLPPPALDFKPPSWWDDLYSGRPVVHVTQGTVNNDAYDLVLPVIDALADEDVLVVATTGHQIPQSLQQMTMPDNVRLAAHIPHNYLLPRTNIMITNGGFGGVQMALANGVPLIIAGATEEKPEVAAHIAWGGLGLNLKTRKPTRAQLKGAVRKLLNDPRYAQRAQRIQALYAERNAAQEAVAAIEAMLKP